MRQASTALPPSLDAPYEARAFCTESLDADLSDREGAGAVISDATLIASELVTNAVLAGATTIRLELSVTDAQLRIEVHDDAPGEVQLAKPEVGATSGRGLLLVAAVARGWGVEPGDGSKRVWAELAI